MKLERLKDRKVEDRYIREIICGKRSKIQYWEVTTDKEHYSPDNSWLIMTRIPQLKYPEVGAIYGVRTWVEYGFKQCKSELGARRFSGDSLPSNTEVVGASNVRLLNDLSDE